MRNEEHAQPAQPAVEPAWAADHTPAWAAAADQAAPGSAEPAAPAPQAPPAATGELPSPPRRERVPSWAQSGPEHPGATRRLRAVPSPGTPEHTTPEHTTPEHTTAPEHTTTPEGATQAAGAALGGERGYRAERGYQAEHGHRAERGYQAEHGHRAERGYRADDGYQLDDGYQVDGVLHGEGAVQGPEAHGDGGGIPGGIPVRGFVRGVAGMPVPRAAVTLISLTGRQLSRSMAHVDGGYTVAAPGMGSYVLIAAADGFQPQATTVVVSDGPVAHDILLSGTSGVSGTVRAADTGGPVPGAVVMATDVRGDVLATGVTDAQGGFGFGGLVPGYVTVAVNAQGYRPQALPLEIGTTGVTRVDVVLGPGARVTGTIRSRGGPLADARVTLVDAAGNVVGTATTGHDGAYGFADLPEGEYTVIATGYPPVASGVWVSGSGIEAHDLVLAHPAE